jgi:prepilin-type N-terminal cleavage/methylation domain-containing protein
MHAPHRPHPSRRTAEHGFTLVELMTVVMIVGVLGTIGLVSFRRQVFGTKTTEAMAMIQSIRAAEERWKAENLRYLNVSKNSNWYPAKPAGRTKRNFYSGGTCAIAADPSEDCRWKLLNPTVTGPVEFGYMVNAGAPSETMTVPATDAKPAGFTAWPATGEHWYVIQAIGDADGDGRYSKFLATSIRADVFQDIGD